MAKIDPNKLKVAKQISRPEILFSIARQPQSSQLYVGTSTARVFHLDAAAAKPQPKALRGHDSYVSGVVLAGNHLVSGGYDGRLIWWDVKTHQKVRAINAHSKWIRRIVATPDQKQIVSVADDMVCRLWDAESGKLVRELKGHAERTPAHFPSMLFVAAVSPDGQQLATADKLGKIVVWETATGKRLKDLHAPGMYTWDPKQRIHSIGGIRSLCFSPDGKLLAAGGISQIGNVDHLGALARIEIFDWRAGKRTHDFPGNTYKGLVEKMAFAPDGSWLLAAGGDHGGFIKFIDLDKKKILRQEKAPMHVHDFVVDENFESIYAAGHGKLVVWQIKA